MSTVRQQMPRSSWRRWSVTVSMLVMAVVYLIAGWIGSGPALGIALFALTLCFTVVLEIAMRRSELVKGLVDRRDERIAAMDLTATAAAGLVLIVVTLAAFAIDLLRGNDGMPYAWLAGVAGVAYIVALAVLRYRS